MSSVSDAEGPCSYSSGHLVAVKTQTLWFVCLNNRKHKMRKSHSRAAINKDISSNNKCAW